MGLLFWNNQHPVHSMSMAVWCSEITHWLLKVCVLFMYVCLTTLYIFTLQYTLILVIHLSYMF